MLHFLKDLLCFSKTLIIASKMDGSAFNNSLGDMLVATDSSAINLVIVPLLVVRS